ncbi:Fe-S oxidoreductase [Salinibacterium sp. NYA9b]
MSRALTLGTRLGRALARAEHSPRAQRVLLNPVVTRPGYWFATASGLLWGGVLSGLRVRSQGGVIVAEHVPRWAFGRGGTTIGAVYLTCDNASDNVLAHEAVHREQWRKYGLWFIPLYLLAGQNPLTNRFEVEAGLELGGYVRAKSTRAPKGSPKS